MSRDLSSRWYRGTYYYTGRYGLETAYLGYDQMVKVWAHPHMHCADMLEVVFNSLTPRSVGNSALNYVLPGSAGWAGCGRVLYVNRQAYRSFGIGKLISNQSGDSSGFLISDLDIRVGALHD